MKADTLDLTAVFQRDIRYVVPLYQRPYVWNMSQHWEPMWADVRGLAEQIEAMSSSDTAARSAHLAPHFLGALVVEQVPTSVGGIDTRQVIDGQQRLTTLQLLIAAGRRVARERALQRHERLLGLLVENNRDLVRVAHHAFKIWPTNADRRVFEAVMTGAPIGDFGAGSSLKIANASSYFEKAIRTWLEEGEGEEATRIEALTTAIRNHLRVVVIDLDAGDNAQVIFETLNARGTPLQAADLIKNVVFQLALAQGAKPDDLYEEYWAPFDTDLWRQQIRQGRLVRPRLDVFFGHWLAMTTGAEVLVHQLFPVFKNQLVRDSRKATELAAELAAAADIFDTFDRYPGDSTEGRFFARQKLLDVSTTFPLLLYVFSVPAERLPAERRATLLLALESYLVRRTVCRLTTKGYNRIFLDLLARVKESPEAADSVVVGFLRSLRGESQYWPSDADTLRALLETPLYITLPRPRVRLILEGIESALRTEMGERVKLFDALQIEHVLPQEWRENWPLPGGGDPEVAALTRDRMKHTLGNLTLLTSKLNPKLSNQPWKSKQATIQEYSVLRVNHELLKHASDDWTEVQIGERGQRLADIFARLWPSPEAGVWTASAKPFTFEFGTPSPLQETESDRDLFEVTRARKVIESMSGDGPGRVAGEALLDELLSWPDSYVRVKDEKGGGEPPRRVRVHKKKSDFGAYAIIYPKPELVTVIFRLPKHFAEGKALAEARDVQSRDPYQVRIKIRSVSEIPEGLELAQSAYDQASVYDVT